MRRSDCDLRTSKAFEASVDVICAGTCRGSSLRIAQSIRSLCCEGLVFCRIVFSLTLNNGEWNRVRSFSWGFCQRDALGTNSTNYCATKVGERGEASRCH